jgi:hypothetical protein
MAPKVSKAAPKSASKKAASSPKPKRAPSPYIIFCTEKRPQVKAENPDATFGQLGKILGSMWAALDDKGKAVSWPFCFIIPFESVVLIFVSAFPVRFFQPYVKSSASKKAALSK